MKALNSLTMCLILLCGAVVLGALEPQWQWTVNAGGIAMDYPNSIAVDSQGNQYITGRFEYTATFGSHTLTAIEGEEDYGKYNTDLFVAKLDPSGNWLWAVQAGGTGYEEGFGIAVDGAGNAYVTGFFGGTATFGSLTLTASEENEIFAAKLDPSGNWLWAVQAGGADADEGHGITVDGAGNAWVTGFFRGTATFGSHTLTASSGSDIFVAKLDPDGNWLWTVQAGGNHSDISCGIALDGCGNACVAGNFYDNTNFGNHALTSIGYMDLFVAKLQSPTPVEDELAPQAIARLHNAYPNPLGRSASAMIKADIPERSIGTLSIFNLRGQMVARHKLNSGTQQITFSGEGLPAGVYLYSLQCGDYQETKKLVLIK